MACRQTRWTPRMPPVGWAGSRPIRWGCSATLATAASYVFLGDSVRALELVLTAADAAREVALDEQIRGYLAMVLAFNEEFGAARVVLDDLVADARRRGAPGALGFPLISLGWVDRTTGRWQDAAAGLHEAAGLASELRRENDECWALSVLSWIEAAQGREAECAAHVGRQLELEKQLGLPFQLAAAHAALGLHALGAGRVDHAIDELSAALDVKQRHSYCDATTYPAVAPDLVEALVRAGAGEAAAVHERFWRRRTPVAARQPARRRSGRPACWLTRTASTRPSRRRWRSARPPRPVRPRPHAALLRRHPAQGRTAARFAHPRDRCDGGVHRAEGRAVGGAGRRRAGAQRPDAQAPGRPRRAHPPSGRSPRRSSTASPTRRSAPSCS